MLSTWRKKFTAQDFKLTEDKPEKFVTCQWQVNDDPKIWYLFYRWTIAIYFFITWLLSILIVKKKTDNFQLKWLIYLTNWGYTTCTFQAMFGAAMLSLCVLSYKTRSFKTLRDKALEFHWVYWVTNSIAAVVACGITIIYWCLIFDKTKNNLDAMNFFLHALNTVVMILDFWMVSHPVKFAHCIYPMGFAAIYAVFSAIYYVAGGTSREGTRYIYPILKWESPFKSLVVCLMVGVFFFLLHNLFYLMYQLRKYLHRKLHRSKSIELTTAVTEGKAQGYINEGMILGDRV